MESHDVGHILENLQILDFHGGGSLAILVLIGFFQPGEILNNIPPELLNFTSVYFLDTGLYTQEQITFVRYIIDWLVQYGTLAHQEMAYDEFSGGKDVTEIFEDNIVLF